LALSLPTIEGRNDRGSFVAGRVIDLSKAAAEALEMIVAGVANVRLHVIYATIASARD
jgi:rare lipoprotein A